ncbi:ADP-dependent glucokinase/phosphofructokinase [Homoserinibacter sp. GY 40078]|uniref:ADP-dependent glucokinase/phosphofructokinase n=1 Tax=Homoserinibacter sp. GY 40078 TaxID=2603275 RepID=UPI0011C86CF3|nr:ADP-dependent glucokinase/phosphofructokinase [Homoserinibacter sp. GY 40078]TXK17441.1 hypothetical protein FVQ89_11455 [Homoserinibacter sp. GY 40078]
MGGSIVLGLGGTVDYEIHWEPGTIDALVEQFGITPDELDVATPILDERSLLVVILAFLRADAGGERHVGDSDLIERFAARFPLRVTLGGTGVRAGIALDSLGIGSVQHLVSIDDTVRDLLPRSMRWISSAHEDSRHPHLIVQYPAGTRVTVGDTVLVSGGANRLIFADDPPNRTMALASDLGDELANAEILLVSGFNTMRDEQLLRTRLRELHSAMERLPSDALVYVEDAGYYVPEFRSLVRQALLPRADVYGMNEDELQEDLRRRVDLLDPEDVVRALQEIAVAVPARTLVVHTRYWAIGHGPEAGRHQAALASAVQMAATRYRCGDGHDAADFAATAALPHHRAGAHVVETVLATLPDTSGVPAFSIAAPFPTTIGLGDTFVGGFLASWARE